VFELSVEMVEAAVGDDGEQVDQNVAWGSV